MALYSNNLINIGYGNFSFKHNVGGIFICFLFQSCSSDGSQLDVSVQENKQDKRIDVMVAGQLFTSYHYSVAYEKPFLFPVYSPNGSVITRGYPLESRKGERVDHPHHTGLWFNHGNVNGLDFWNNSSAIKDKDKYGHIVVTKVLKTQSGRKYYRKYEKYTSVFI